ncbi:MAG: prenyltransferase/squalene oxidase repeat-containing protein [Planctomycetota bacterium]
MPFILRQSFTLILIFILYLFSACNSYTSVVETNKEFNLDDNAIKNFYKMHKKDLIIPASVEYKRLQIYYPWRDEEAQIKLDTKVKDFVREWKNDLTELQEELRRQDISCSLFTDVFYYLDKQTDKEAVFGETLTKISVGIPTIISCSLPFDEFPGLTVICILKKTEPKELPFSELTDRIYTILATYSESDLKIWDNNMPEILQIYWNIQNKTEDINKAFISERKDIEGKIDEAVKRNDWEQVTKLGDKILETEWKGGYDWIYFRIGKAFYETKQYKKAAIAYHRGSVGSDCGNCTAERMNTKYSGLAKTYEAIGDIHACIKYSILPELSDDFDSLFGSPSDAEKFIEKYKVNMERIIAGARIIVSHKDFNFPPPEWLRYFHRKGKYPITKKENKRDSVLSGLIWLAKHQNPDGSWGAKSFQNQCRVARCSGKGDERYNIGLTGLSMIAFTGAGYTNSSRDTYEGICFGDVVRKGALYLTGIQLSDGSFGGVKEDKFMYNQALATYAMADLYVLTMDNPAGVIFKEPVEKAVEYLLDAQNPGKGWGYQPQDGKSDSLVTGWVIFALKTADKGGIPFSFNVYDSIKSFFNNVTDKSSGKVGYTEPNDITHLSQQSTLLPTAIGINVRIFIDKNTNDPLIKLGVNQLISNLPVWDVSKPDMIDYNYWFFASYSLQQYNGPTGQVWDTWSEKIKDVLMKNQRTNADGCANGSWDRIDQWGQEGGRVYSTAINVLTLEVYYRLGILRLMNR